MPLLRDYHPSDFDTLVEIDQACFPPDIAYSRKEFGHYLRSSRAVCVLAVDGSKTLGFILGHCRTHCGHIITLDVILSARSHGIGSLLMNALEKRFRLSGCHS